MKRFTLILLFLLSGLSAGAQYFPVNEDDGAILKGIKWTMNQMIRPSTNRDTTYLWVAPPELKIQVSNTLRKNGMTMSWNFKDNYDEILDDGSTRTISVPGTTRSDMLGGFTKNIGISASYNKFGFSMSRELNKKRKWHNKKYSFSYKTGPWAFNYSYFKIKDGMNYRITIGDDPSQPYYSDKKYTSDLDWTIRYHLFDVYYTLNKRHFAQNAAFGRKTIQRKSAGSVMLAARYMQAKISFAPNEYMAYCLGDIDTYTTYQVSVGAGYSYNLVFWHLDPQPTTFRAFNSNARKGLRNITLSMTLIPLFTAFNQIHLKPRSTGIVKSVLSKPQLNWLGNLSFGINIDRFSFGTRITYDRSLFKSYHSTKKPDDFFYNIHWKGNFYNVAFSTYLIWRI